MAGYMVCRKHPGKIWWEEHKLVEDQRCPWCELERFDPTAADRFESEHVEREDRE